MSAIAARLDARAKGQPLPDCCAGVVVIAQAQHGFATPLVFADVTRLLQPGELFAVWCGGLQKINTALNSLIEYCSRKGLACAQGTTSPIEIARSIFVIRAERIAGLLFGYLGTWPAVLRQKARHDHLR